MPMPIVLVLYYSRHGATAALARHLARGIEKQQCEARLRTVPGWNGRSPGVPAAYAEPADLRECDALALGSPVRFGSMAAPLKHFLEQTSADWLCGSLIGKPACVFTSSASPHGGQEANLLGMMLPLLHHGMLLVGLPYSEPDLHTTSGGGSPYGASHVDALGASRPLTDSEIRLADALGQRLGALTKKLAS